MVSLTTSPLVSVVIPTYNHSQYLPIAIKSVLDQTYPNIEIVIVDNYSTDKTEEIVKSFQDNQPGEENTRVIKYFKFANKGIIAASRNYGIKQAQGEYIAFLDSDDVWYEDKTTQQVKVISRDQEIGLVYCTFNMINGEGVSIKKVVGPNVHDIKGYCYDQLLNCNFVVASSALVKKQVLDDVGGFDESEDLVASEDYDLWLNIARQYKIEYVDGVHGDYRVHAANVSADGFRVQKAINVVGKHVQKGWLTKHKYNQCCGNFYFREGWSVIGADVKFARQNFIKTIKVSLGHPHLFIFGIVSLFFSVFPSFCVFIKNYQPCNTWINKILDIQNIRKKAPAAQNKRKTVALLCTALHGLGGTSQHMLQLYRHLDHQKYRVLLVFYSRCKDQMVNFFKSGGVKAEDIYYVPFSFNTLFLGGISRLRHLWSSERVDIVHSFFLHSDILAYVSALLSGGRCLISSVEGKFLLDETNGIPKWKQFCYRHINNAIRKAFCKTITVSNDLRQEVLEASREVSDIQVIPIGISVPDTQNVMAHNNHDAKVVASVSRLTKDKGVHYFIEAISYIHARLPHVKFVVAGSGEEESRLKQLAFDLGVDRRIDFVGWVDDIGGFLNNIDVFVMPSMREGCPVGLLEAFSHKMPVVGFSVAGVNEVLIHQKNGLAAPPYETRILAEHIVSLVNDDAEALRLGENAYKDVVERFTIDNEIIAIDKIYQGCFT